MKSDLTAQHYYDPNIFNAEIGQIFNRLWIFATIRTLDSYPNSFITREIGGIPLLIQSCVGKIKAIKNRCSRRLKL
jgi:phenylpropionate dioxygenase-like ring-hydroxylating dioxygenase large terminal subunit